MKEIDYLILRNIRIVLVEPSHPGNIGSVARVMKTMGLSQLYLVNPLTPLDHTTVALSAGAADVIATAVQVEQLENAIADCHLVVGFSARKRGLHWPLLTPRECAMRLAQQARQSPVAVLFGRESCGLTNAELQQCHYQIVVPTNPHYCSLNLAMAVQILAYELFGICYCLTEEIHTPAVEYPSMSEIDYFYRHLERVLSRIDFIQPYSTASVIARLRCLLTRALLEKRELQMLRGILTAIEQAVSTAPLSSAKPAPFFPPSEE